MHGLEQQKRAVDCATWLGGWVRETWSRGPRGASPRRCRWGWPEPLDTATGALEFRRVAYDVEQAAKAVEATDLPAEFAAQLREARGYQ